MMISPVELQLIKIGLCVLLFCAIYSVVYSMVEASRRRTFEKKLLAVLSRADETVLESQSGLYAVLTSIEKHLQARR